jgi:hypothetical protein
VQEELVAKAGRRWRDGQSSRGEQPCLSQTQGFVVMQCSNSCARVVAGIIGNQGPSFFFPSFLGTTKMQNANSKSLAGCDESAGSGGREQATEETGHRIERENFAVGGGEEKERVGWMEIRKGWGEEWKRSKKVWRRTRGRRKRGRMGEWERRAQEKWTRERECGRGRKSESAGARGPAG